MEAIAIIIVVAAIIEAVVETINMIIHSEVKWQNIVAAVLGIVMAYFYGIGIMGAMGIIGPMIIDVLITGLLMSRGSNFISDLWDRLNAPKVK